MPSVSPSGENIFALFDESEIDEFGNEMFALCEELWPLNRSLTGDGNRKTLEILRREFPSLEIREVPSGTQAFDWEVPLEWVVREAWIKTPDGRKICDFVDNNLHLVGYSVAVNQKMSLEELQDHLYSLPEQTEAIPYVTSYYSPHWGFCISEKDRAKLPPGTYEIYIDSSHTSGSMTYGEVVIPGSGDSEVLLSTYICHPSMANNELSGIAVAIRLSKWLSSVKNLTHTYRILFLPETIGAITYLSQHLPELKEKLIAGYVLTCVGDDRSYSYVPSRRADSLADEAALHVLKHLDPSFKRYRWADRQSDERQYCAPHVNLPVASIMRTKYGSYPEYHTSLDTLGEVVTAKGLAGGMLAYMRAIQILELNFQPVVSSICEPQLGKRGLYPTVSRKGVYEETRLVREVLGYSDGNHSVLEISNLANVEFSKTYATVASLLSVGLLRHHGTP